MNCSLEMLMVVHHRTGGLEIWDHNAKHHQNVHHRTGGLENLFLR